MDLSVFKKICWFTPLCVISGHGAWVPKISFVLWAYFLDKTFCKILLHRLDARKLQKGVPQLSCVLWFLNSPKIRRRLLQWTMHHFPLTSSTLCLCNHALMPSFDIFSAIIWEEINNNLISQSDFYLKLSGYHEYKFIVDGIYMVDVDRPHKTNSFGYHNNWMEVKGSIEGMKYWINSKYVQK